MFTKLLASAAILSACSLLSACGGASHPPGWNQVTGPGPSPRWTHAAVLDPSRRNAVVFGGFAAGNEGLAFLIREPIVDTGGCGEWSFASRFTRRRLRPNS